MSNKISIDIKDLQDQQQTLSTLATETNNNYQNYSELLEKFANAVSGKIASNVRTKTKSSLKAYNKLGTDLQLGADVAQRVIDAFYSSDQDLKNKTQNMDQVLIEISGGDANQSHSNQTVSDYYSYREAVEKINNAVPIGQAQQKQRQSDGSPDKGICTYAAATTLLQRKQVADGDEVSYTFDDVYRANGGRKGQNGDKSWPDDSSFNFCSTYKKDGSSSYTTTYREGSIDTDSVRKLLDNHPEGIAIWSPSSGGNNHAIVITDYEINSDGSIQFYADDPVNNASDSYKSGRVKLEDTYLYALNKDIFGTAQKVYWIQ